MNSWMINLQNSNSPIFDLMIFFHDFTMMILLFIMILIIYIFYSMIFNNFINRFLLQGHTIELIWTIIPMFILIFIALPSIKILYLSDEMYNNSLTIKILSYQWYWNYEYSNFLNINFNSFMIPTDQLMKKEFRLLDVDNRCILPMNLFIRTLTSSMDVIHSWTIPSLGIKMDSTPGRLNQSTIFLSRPGLFYGQCSEICGMNHSFMPIVIESTNLYFFKLWLKSF